jgi:FKBP-type peptidyl-prolyl cis-trans isomerase 2
MADGFPWATVIVLVVVVVAGAGGASAYIYFHDRPSGAPSVLIVAVGDNVTVNYIGVFGSGPESGRVFDTSVFSVAVDNSAFPKALTFHPRGLPQNYSPLDVHVGSSTPSSGYTVGPFTFIQVVTGFWQGLVGLSGNETHAVSVPPALGYGPTNPACVATYPITQTVPIVQTMPGLAFTAKYPGTLATTGATFTDPHFGWPVLILAANATSVTLQNMPHVGETAEPSGWPIMVTAVTSTANGSGLITLVNQLAPSQAGHLLGKDYLGTGPCSAQAKGQFIVTAVNLAAGTYIANFNQEVQGETLIFFVTVVTIFTPSVTKIA